jgi:hypothetical protein
LVEVAQEQLRTTQQVPTAAIAFFQLLQPQAEVPVATMQPMAAPEVRVAAVALQAEQLPAVQHLQQGKETRAVTLRLQQAHSAPVAAVAQAHQDKPPTLQLNQVTAAQAQFQQ